MVTVRLGKPKGDERLYPLGDGVRLLRVNILCLAGAALALICLALPWGIETNHEATPDYPAGYDFHTQLRLTDPINFEGDAHLTSILMIVILGGVISAISPLGGFVQLLGVMSYVAHMGRYTEALSVPIPWITAHFSYGGGFYLAIFAVLVTLLSTMIPFGIRGFSLYNPISGERPTIRQRLLVWDWREAANRESP